MDRAFTSLDKGVFWVENEVILDGRDKKPADMRAMLSRNSIGLSAINVQYPTNRATHR